MRLPPHPGLERVPLRPAANCTGGRDPPAEPAHAEGRAPEGARGRRHRRRRPARAPDHDPALTGLLRARGRTAPGRSGLLGRCNGGDGHLDPPCRRAAHVRTKDMERCRRLDSGWGHPTLYTVEIRGALRLGKLAVMVARNHATRPRRWMPRPLSLGGPANLQRPECSEGDTPVGGSGAGKCNQWGRVGSLYIGTTGSTGWPPRPSPPPQGPPIATNPGRHGPAVTRGGAGNAPRLTRPVSGRTIRIPRVPYWFAIGLFTIVAGVQEELASWVGGRLERCAAG